MTPYVDAATMRRLLVHEAQVHALPGRDLRDLGDAILLHDPGDPEPFWNRLEAIRWPSDPDAFDRRLAELGILFASLGRQPHIWVSPSHDDPPDLVARLVANGFEDVGPGNVMITQDPRPARAVLSQPRDAGRGVVSLTGLSRAAADEAAPSIVSVLLEAFGVEADRRPGVTAETVASLEDPRFTHYLVADGDRALSVARRATFDGVSYLSSIGTTVSARGRGLGRLVTAAAVVDAFEAGSEWVHLGVFSDNEVAIRLYERLGFRPAGEPGPDMMLVG